PVTGMGTGAVNAIAQDSSGFIWFGTADGLSRYDGYDFDNYRPGDDQNTLSSFTVTALAPAKDALWIGTVKGLDKLDLASGTFSHFKAGKEATALSSDDISSLHLGASGLLWIGSVDAGVDSLDPASGAVHHYRKQQGLADDGVSAVFEAVDRKVWIGTREAG